MKILHQHPETQKVQKLHHWILADFELEELAKLLQTWRNTLPAEALVAWVSSNPTVEAHLFQHLNASGFLPINKQSLLNSSTKGGVDFTYYQASWDTMGVDRVLNVLRFAQTFPNETGVVINTGTATTIDIIISGKTYGGGAVLPGIAAWQGALPQQVRHLPLPLPLNASVSFKPPTSTQEAITHGAVYPYAMGVLAYAQQLARYWHAPFTQMVITGGYAGWLQQGVQGCLALQPLESAEEFTLILDEQWSELAIFNQFYTN